jgi:hypothetical protein
MQPEGSRISSEGDRAVDQAVLNLLVNDPGPGPWAVEELVREIGDPVIVEDALARLHGEGLIHRLAGFAFATRAAAHAAELM